MKIIKYPDPRLRKKSLPIKNPTDPKIQKLILEMIQLLRANQAIGLAAPQIGENIRLCLIEIENELFVLINPEIKSLSGKKVIYEEGCLSFPGKFIPIKRFERVKVKAIDMSGKKQIIRARGLFARAIQHEVDHLDGKLFIDLLEHNDDSSYE